VNGLIAAVHDGTARAIVSRLSVGSAPDRLLQMSQAPRAELIVLGKRPRHWLADLFLDRGMASRMLAEGASDLLLVPEQGERNPQLSERTGCR